jgi:chromosome segregation ATPase
VDVLNALLPFVRDNAGNIATGLIGLMTTVLGYKVMFGQNRINSAKVRVEADKVSIDAKKIDLDEDRISFERASAIDQRMDRLVAHLERQLENAATAAREQAEEARKEREEMKKVMSTQTREIVSLREHVSRLTKMIVNLGHVPPDYEPTKD